MSAGKPPLPLQKPPGYRDPNKPPRRPPPVKLRRKSCCRTCCCSFCIVIIILILAFVSVGLTFYLYFQPCLPQIHLKSINFTKFNVSMTTDGGELNAASIVTVEIKNPNQNLGIVYGKTRILLSALNVYASLGEQTVGGFSQEKDNVTTLKLAPKVERKIIDRECAAELKSGFKNNNLVLNAEIRSGIGLKQRRWSTAPIEVEVLCRGIRLAPASTPKCRIKLLNRYA